MKKFSAEIDKYKGVYKCSKEDCILKKQNIQLCSSDQSKQVYTYVELAELLNIKKDDVEEWIFESITNELIDARID